MNLLPHPLWNRKQHKYRVHEYRDSQNLITLQKDLIIVKGSI